MRRLNDLIQSYIDNQDILGAAIAILQDGDLVYLGGFGKTSIEENSVPVTPHTLFAYGSISKTICATLIMRLIEGGLLDLDTPVLQYLPDLQFSNPDLGRKITLRHVLSHTTGLPAAGKDWGLRDRDSLRRFVYEQIPHYKFLSEPGSVHLYSSTVFCIAGHVAEAVTGRYYEDLAQKYVFDPLKMTSTTFDPAVAVTYPVALPHETSPEGDLRVLHRMPSNASGNPSGFAIGSVSDLANLAQMYINEGILAFDRFLSSSSMIEMLRPHASRHIEGHAHPLAHVYQGYGLGINVGHYRGRRAARHGGMSLSYNCFFDLFPDERAGILLLTNYSQEEPLMELVTALYDHALGLPHRGIVPSEKPQPIDPLPGIEQLQCYAGTYLNVETAVLASFNVVDYELVLERQGQSLQLVPFGDARFLAQVSENYRLSVAFFDGSAGKVNHVMIAGESYFPVELDPAFQPDLSLWKAYEGVYKDPSNTNPEETFIVRLQDNAIYIAEGEHEAPGKAISNRSFLSDLGLIEFEDSDSDEVKVLVWGKATRYYPQ